MKRVFLALLLLTGCEAHHLFGPTKPSLRLTKRDYNPEQCYFTITHNGVTYYYPIPCNDD